MEREFLEDLYRRYSGSVFRRACLLMDDRDTGKDVMPLNSSLKQKW